MKTAPQNANACLCTTSARIINHGEHFMAWFYEIRDSNKVVLEKEEGFASQKAAAGAGRKKARELKAAGSLANGVGTVEVGQNSLQPASRSRQ
jgi:hypothetical protein